MTLFIIFTCLFIFSSALLFACIFADCDAKVALLIVILFSLSLVGMKASAESVKPDVKPIEYPSSEYNFKIKVVEFEEHRDTILVVTPKDKIK